MDETLVLEVLRGIVDWRYVLTSTLISYMLYYILIQDRKKPKKWKDSARKYLTAIICSIMSTVFLVQYDMEWTSVVVSWAISQLTGREIVKLITRNKKED